MEKIWSVLVHLGSNMWNEEGNLTGRGENRSNRDASPVLRFDRKLWDEHMLVLKEKGVNTIVMDVGEAMQYESHPELQVKGSWSHDEMRAEIKRLNDLGFDVIPKLNFSACHDVWLKEYHKMLSTKIYYDVCRDVINETLEVFKPKYFHLGMDEETAANQRNFSHISVRQGDLWWHDLNYLVDLVEKGNARAWVWADACWHHPEEYVKRMPKSVVQNNWYYHNQFNMPEGDYWGPGSRSFELLDKHGFDQVPAGSVFSSRDNLLKLTQFATETVDDTRLLGFMQTSWERIAEGWMHVHETVAETIGEAKEWYDNK